VEATGEGMRLADFAALPEARSVNLRLAHVLALRLYSTAAYKSINNPLRDTARTAEHPFPATVFMLSDAVKKLRAVRATDGRAATDAVVAYRGMRNMELPERFVSEGGTEYAPMSTTTSLSVALKYALSRRSLLFRISAPSFMQAGADLGFVSAFPTEAELLYPPGTYLRPTGYQETFKLDDNTSVHVIDVEPAT